MIERLVELGFTSSEARVYLALLRQPEATGYELAKAAELQRANAYAALASLSAKDLVTRTRPDGPARYVAAPPAEALGRIKRSTERTVDSLIADLALLPRRRRTAAFYQLRGREAVIDRVVSLVDGAEHRLAVCAWAEDLDWLGGPLRAAAQSGCRVVVNLFGDADVDFGEVYRHESPDRTVGGHLLTLTVDATIALIAEFGAEPTAISTDQPALVQLVEKLIRDEAYLAAIFDRHKDDLERSFGPHLVSLRSRLLPAEQVDQLVSIVGFGADGIEPESLRGQED